MAANLNALPEVTWIEPAPDGLVLPDGDPAEVAVARETIRLAFVAALQHLPPRQRAVLILCEVLRWKATEVAELLETSVASVNSALQRAHKLDARDRGASEPELGTTERELLARYVEAFERYDMDALTSLIHEDATQSMPPFDLWLRGRMTFSRWWGGAGCRGSRVIPTLAANGSRVRPVQAERNGRRPSPGLSRSSRSIAAESSSSFFSAPTRRCSACRPGSRLDLIFTRAGRRRAP